MSWLNTSCNCRCCIGTIGTKTRVTNGNNCVYDKIDSTPRAAMAKHYSSRFQDRAAHMHAWTQNSTARLVLVLSC